jgi:hypothetical protein
VRMIWPIVISFGCVFDFVVSTDEVYRIEEV